MVFFKLILGLVVLLCVGLGGCDSVDRVQKTLKITEEQQERFEYILIDLELQKRNYHEREKNYQKHQANLQDQQRNYQKLYETQSSVIKNYNEQSEEFSKWFSDYKRREQEYKKREKEYKAREEYYLGRIKSLERQQGGISGIQYSD